jgi:hypothetical protein
VTEAQLTDLIRRVHARVLEYKKQGGAVTHQELELLDIEEALEDYRAVVRQVTHPRSVQEQLDPEAARND